MLECDRGPLEFSFIINITFAVCHLNLEQHISVKK